MSPRSRAAAAGSVPERRDVYERLADELRQAIVSGQYQPGDRLPSTLDLMERTGVANLTVRGAYRVLVEEGLVESVTKRGFYVRRPSVMTWRMNPPAAAGAGRGRAGRLGRRRRGRGAGHREEISVAIEDSSAPDPRHAGGGAAGAAPRVTGPGRRRSATPAPRATPLPAPDSLADEYYPYDLVRDTALASPAPASPLKFCRLGHRLRGHRRRARPRVATTEERRLLSLPQVSVVLELARTAQRDRSRSSSCTRSGAATAPPFCMRPDPQAGKGRIRLTVPLAMRGCNNQRRYEADGAVPGQSTSSGRSYHGNRRPILARAFHLSVLGAAAITSCSWASRWETVCLSASSRPTVWSRAETLAGCLTRW